MKHFVKQGQTLKMIYPSYELGKMGFILGRTYMVQKHLMARREVLVIISGLNVLQLADFKSENENVLLTQFFEVVA